ncbi:MAG: tetratricopeptide repeat protein, partial [Bdellovibrionota bacterium]
MVTDAKQTQLAKFARNTGKILPAALISLGFLTSPLRAESANQSLETSIWTSGLHDYASLEKAAVRALQQNPAGAYEHYLVAELSLRMFKQHPEDLRYLKQASDMSQQAIELAPTKEYGYLVAAQVLDLMGYKADAAEMLSERPSFAQGWRTPFVRAIISSTYEGEKTSLSDFEKSLKAPGVAKEIVGSYIALNLESNYAGTELVQKLEIWNRKADTTAMRISLAKALDESGEPNRAQAILADLNKKNPSEETRLAESTLLYAQLNRTKDAETLLLSLAANGKDQNIRMAAKSHLAKIRLQKGDTRTAASLFGESIEGTTDKLKWISFSHNAYRQQHKLIDFTALLTDLSVRLPGSSYLYALQGEVLSENLAQHEKAVESFEAAITLDPRRSEFYNGMGLAYYRMQKHEKALAVFNKAISLDPKDATARYNEACVLSLMGRGSEAVGSLEKAILLDGRLQSVALTDKDFESLRTNAEFQSLV